MTDACNAQTDPGTPVVTLVVPVYNEAAGLAAFFSRARAALEALALPWEMVFVDDGSRDASLLALLALREQDRRVVVIALTRNFGKEVALTAGLDHARGDAVIPIDADLQHPPEVIGAMVAAWRKGSEMVIAVRNNAPPMNPLRRAMSALFYRLFRRLTAIELPHASGDFRLMSSAVVNALRALPERTRFMKGLYAWVGFPYTTVGYDVDPRQRGHSSFGMRRLWRLGSDAITSFSAAPLRVASVSGLVIAAVAFVYGAWMVGKTIVLGIDLPGYASTITLILLLGGLQLLSLGVVGEYIARIYDEVKARPLYVVRSRHGAAPPS